MNGNHRQSSMLGGLFQYAMFLALSLLHELPALYCELE